MQVNFSLDGKTAFILEAFTLAGVTVPAGFRSDGISSPCWSWFRYHPFSRFVAAAFVHDFCIEIYGYPYARDKFIEALMEMGVNPIDVYLLYNAVRLKDWQRRVSKRIKF